MHDDTREFRRLIGKHLERGHERPVPEYATLVINEYNYSYFSHHGKVDAMNYSTAIFLINDDVRALYVVFEPDRKNEQKAPRCMVKTLDRDIRVGDIVVVPWPMGHEKIAVATVTEADVEVDFDNAINVPWVICRVDLTEFNEVIQKEKVAVRAIREARFIAKKKKLGEELMNARDLLALPLASKKVSDDYR